jgi:hypothetical protein
MNLRIHLGTHILCSTDLPTYRVVFPDARGLSPYPSRSKAITTACECTETRSVLGNPLITTYLTVRRFCIPQPFAYLELDNATQVRDWFLGVDLCGTLWNFRILGQSD